MHHIAAIRHSCVISGSDHQIAVDWKANLGMHSAIRETSEVMVLIIRYAAVRQECLEHTYQ